MRYELLSKDLVKVQLSSEADGIQSANQQLVDLTLALASREARTRPPRVSLSSAQSRLDLCIRHTMPRTSEHSSTHLLVRMGRALPCYRKPSYPPKLVVCRHPVESRPAVHVEEKRVRAHSGMNHARPTFVSTWIVNKTWAPHVSVSQNSFDTYAHIAVVSLTATTSGNSLNQPATLSCTIPIVTPSSHAITASLNAVVFST